MERYDGALFELVERYLEFTQGLRRRRGTRSTPRPSANAAVSRPLSPRGALTITGFAPSPSGSTIGPTPYMNMLWQVPVAGGPLAIQPSDIQIVEAATMQTSS